MNAQEWAATLGIPTAPVAPAMAPGNFTVNRSPREVAVRILCLQSVAAVASGVAPGPVLAWLEAEGTVSALSPRERRFLLDPAVPETQRVGFQWRQEAEWTLLWVVGMVEALGLPTRQCDSKRLVHEIIPELGSATEGFVASASLREPSLVLAEDDRTFRLWVAVAEARRLGRPLPDDLILAVLHQRRYALEWLDGIDEWDDVVCDA